MATHILFWNPAISSFTMDDFYVCYNGKGDVDNWSFHEHEDVKPRDIFYMIRCGEGKTGIVMRGEISSSCYEDEDWSPQKRKHIFYANLDENVLVDSENYAVMLTPEFLSKYMPDFNWFGGHSGRKLSKEYAEQLDDIWLKYIDENPQLFADGHIKFCPYQEPLLTEKMQETLWRKLPEECEICGYSYTKAFGKEFTAEFDFRNYPAAVVGHGLKRLFYGLCRGCMWVESIDDTLADALRNKGL